LVVYSALLYRYICNNTAQNINCSSVGACSAGGVAGTANTIINFGNGEATMAEYFVVMWLLLMALLACLKYGSWGMARWFVLAMFVSTVLMPGGMETVELLMQLHAKHAAKAS
jgi:hypothetical protein